MRVGRAGGRQVRGWLAQSPGVEFRRGATPRAQVVGVGHGAAMNAHSLFESNPRQTGLVLPHASRVPSSIVAAAFAAVTLCCPPAGAKPNLGKKLLEAALRGSTTEVQQLL